MKKLNIFRSKFEQNVFKKISSSAVYEPEKWEYNIPASKHSYTVDLFLPNCNVYVELKGVLDLQTRKKMVLIRDQHPEKRIVFVFQNENNKIAKNSKTTYRMWAEKNGFEVWTLTELIERAK